MTIDANYGRINNCHTFLARLIENQLGSRLPPVAQDFFEVEWAHSENFEPGDIKQDVRALQLQTAVRGQPAGNNGVKKFLMTKSCGSLKSIRAGACKAQVTATEDKEVRELRVILPIPYRCWQTAVRQRRVL